ncbi:hypothetical protein E2C01_028230 [Portunus trituberculatus]|uniref:Uncharacterized protein n=1 Tax=Portunus trituberculatus TaxID=210409 RepID=A0A5B7ENH6_PORTR|nr:hypothetical protein [Portunus trituberculatus]
MQGVLIRDAQNVDRLSGGGTLAPSGAASVTTLRIVLADVHLILCLRRTTFKRLEAKLSVRSGLEGKVMLEVNILGCRIWFNTLTLSSNSDRKQMLENNSDVGRMGKIDGIR